MLDRDKLPLAQDPVLETMVTWVLRVTIRAKLLSMETADMDLQLPDKVVVVTVEGRLKDMTDKAVVLVKMSTMRPKFTTAKVEDTARLLPKILTPRTMDSMELQLGDMVVDNLKDNMRTISIQMAGDHFLLQIVSTPPTHHDR
jgi:hypothetical protein